MIEKGVVCSFIHSPVMGSNTSHHIQSIHSPVMGSNSMYDTSSEGPRFCSSSIASPPPCAASLGWVDLLLLLLLVVVIVVVVVGDEKERERESVCVCVGGSMMGGFLWWSAG